MTADLEEYRQLALAYARACDQNDGAALLALFAPGGELVGPRSVRSGDKIAEVPSLLAAQYILTRHEILTQSLASGLRGETTCNASHFYPKDKEPDTILVMAVRYEDALTRVDGILRLLKRTLHIAWQEKRTVLPKEGLS